MSRLELSELVLGPFENLTISEPGPLAGAGLHTMELPLGASYTNHAVSQHDMVKMTQGRFMTPALLPSYRVFILGIMMKLRTAWNWRQHGPWP